jgi:hypothetical protein
MRSVVAALALAAVANSSAWISLGAASVDPDPGLSYARSDAGATWICPRSDGNLAAWVVPSGIEVHLFMVGGSPVAGVPSADVWLTSSSASFAFCGGAMLADADTDATGTTSFSHSSPPAGGCLPGQQAGVDLALHVTALGIPIPSDIRLDFNSPDITGDLQVNLADVGPFSSALNGAYNFCADFFHDGVVNLSDVGIFSAHLGHSCP